MWCAYLEVSIFKSVIEVFEKCTKDSSSQRDHRAYSIHKYIFWSDCCQKRSNFGQILVRFLRKIGQIVSQILENFYQILTISTLLL